MYLKAGVVQSSQSISDITTSIVLPPGGGSPLHKYVFNSIFDSMCIINEHIDFLSTTEVHRTG